MESAPQSIQRFMLAAPGPEPIREAEEVGLVDVVEYFHRRTLNELVFERRNAERSQAMRLLSRSLHQRPRETAGSVRA
jgi:hypothetical protein